MPDISTIQSHPPKSWDEFEDICADLFIKVWNDIHTDRYGRSGQRQNGVDIFGRSNERLCGVQCKGKQNWPLTKLTVADINSEVAKALEFTPLLSELIFATTAPSDIAATDRANEISEEHRKEGLFSVHVWSWDKITRELTKHPELVSKHYGLVTNEAIKNDVRALADQVTETAKPIALPTKFADAEIQKSLSPIIAYRYLQGFDHKDRVSSLLDELLHGIFRNGSLYVKSNALGWCARLLAKMDLPSARKALEAAKKIDESDVTIVAEAFILAEENDIKPSLSLLNDLATPAAQVRRFPI